MKQDKKMGLSLVVLTMLLLCVGGVFATISYTGITTGDIVRQDTTIGYTSNKVNTKNITLTIYDSSNNVYATQRTEANTSTYALDYDVIPAGSYTFRAVGVNITDAVEDTGALVSFTVTGCNTTSYALWGIVLLTFVVGLLYFAYMGFIEGKMTGIISFIIMLTITAVIIANVSLSTLRSLC